MSSLNQDIIATAEIAVFVARLADPEARILEIGCGDGSVLAALRLQNRRNLTGFESDESKISRLSQLWPDIAEACKIHNGRLGELVAAVPLRGFDVVIIHDTMLPVQLLTSLAYEVVVTVGLPRAPFEASGLRFIDSIALADGRECNGFLVTMAMRTKH